MLLNIYCIYQYTIYKQYINNIQTTIYNILITVAIISREKKLIFIAIDDARPEALPRDPKNERLVLEGGLLKIKDAIINYDYGFGLDNNVFGCLGEAFMLALSNGENLKPTLGDVDIQNFLNMLNFSRENGVLAGDLKSSEDFISHEDVKEAFFRRGFIQNE